MIEDKKNSFISQFSNVAKYFLNLYHAHFLNNSCCSYFHDFEIDINLRIPLDLNIDHGQK